MGAAPLDSTAAIITAGTGLMGTIPGFPGTLDSFPLSASASITTGEGLIGTTLGFSASLGRCPFVASGLMGATPGIPGSMGAAPLSSMAFIVTAGTMGVATIMGAATIVARADPGLIGTEDGATSSAESMASFLEFTWTISPRCSLDIGVS